MVPRQYFGSLTDCELEERCIAVFSGGIGRIGVACKGFAM